MEDYGYAMYLSWDQNQRVLRLPVLPESLEVSQSTELGNEKVFGLGEVQTEQVQKLEEISLSSHFPLQQYPYVTSKTLLLPVDYVRQITQLQRSDAAFYFVLVTPFMKVSLPVKISSFEWKEQAGSPGDLEYTLSLKKYRSVQAKRVKLKDVSKNVPSSRGTSGSASASAPMKQTIETKKSGNRLDNRKTPKTYTTGQNDSWFLIAFQFRSYYYPTYNEQELMNEIIRLNPDVKDDWRGSVKIIKEGTVIKLP